MTDSIAEDLRGRLKTSWDGHYMYPAFIGYVHFALSRADALAQFRVETGNTFQPALTSLDRMIDEATGRDLAFAQAFIDWCEKQFGTPSDINEAVA